MRTNKKEKSFSLRHYLAIVLLSGALLAIPFGCAHTPKTAPPSSEQEKVDLGTIGIVTGRFPPEVKLQKPMGKAGGAGAGALVGAAAAGGTVLYVASCAGPIGILLLGYPPITAVAGGITGAGAVIGGVAGAVKGESSKKKKETEVTLNTVFSDINIQETVRNHILKECQEQTRHRFVLLDHKGPVTPDDNVDYRPLTNESIETVLEVSPLKFGLIRKDINVNPTLSFQMKIRARLVRVIDGMELYVHTFKYEGGRKKYIDWSEDAGQPFRKEFYYGVQSISKDIVDIIFLKYFPPESRQNNSANSPKNDLPQSEDVDKETEVENENQAYSSS